MEGHQVQPGSCLPTAGHPPCGGDDINRSAHVSRNREQQATAIEGSLAESHEREGGSKLQKHRVGGGVELRVAEGC